MEQQYDINTIDAHDFNTPRKKNKNTSSRHSLNMMPRIGSNHEIYFSPDSISYSRNHSSIINDQQIGRVNRDIKSTTLHTSPFQPRQPPLRQQSQDFTGNISDFSIDKINLNAQSVMIPQKQPLAQFSFSRENYDLLTKQNKQEPQQEPQPDSRFVTVQKQMSPLGIPYQPFHHTRSGFKSKSNLNETFQQHSNQLHNSSSDDQNNFSGSDMRGDSQFGNLRNKSCFVQRDDKDDILNRYDQKILDISDTLKQLQQYKSNLHQLQQQNHKKRSKSHHSPHAKTDNIGKLPAIKQPVMYFSPMDEPSPKHQKKLRKAKKQKQMGMQQLAKQILNNLPQEKLANLMAINMYNQALYKKEVNQEKITNVIEEQNKLLSKMLEQYEKKQVDAKKQIRSNLFKIDGDKSYDSQKFEKDKRSFEKAYSNIQSKFQKELHSIPQTNTIHNNENYMSRPLLTEGDLPDQIRNTKHLKRIHTHSQKYKQFTPLKIYQPPMQF